MTLTREFFIPARSTKIADKASGAVAYVYTTAKGLPAAALFSGKRAKPDGHYSFRTPAAREEAVRRHFGNARSAITRRQDRAAERKVDAQDHGLEVGHVLVSSWGYDQTNVDFYQVTALVGRTMVEVRKVASVETTPGDMTGKVIPAIGEFSGKPSRHRADRNGITIDGYRRARVWEGRPMYVSSYH